MKRVIANFFKYTAIVTPYACMWVYTILVCRIKYAIFSEYSLFRAVYGLLFSCLGTAVVALVFCSIIYLRFLIKKEWVVYLVAYVATILVLVAIFTMGTIGENKMKIFTTEKWSEHPGQRMLMYSDLKEKYIVEGYTFDQVKELLGEPDYIGPPDMYFYYSSYFEIRIQFENGKVLYMYVRN